MMFHNKINVETVCQTFFVQLLLNEVLVSVYKKNECYMNKKNYSTSDVIFPKRYVTERTYHTPLSALCCNLILKKPKPVKNI